ncbi:MAG: hypothetical protein J0L75_17990 [Spirochaetes bacterium]|nr:hypothetical protein [Spirochaetota bacterium]
MSEILTFIQQHPIALVAVAVCLVAAIVIYKIVKKLLKIALVLAIAAGLVFLVWKMGFFSSWFG